MSFLLDFLTTLVGLGVRAYDLESQDLDSKPIKKISQKYCPFLLSSQDWSQYSSKASSKPKKNQGIWQK